MCYVVQKNCFAVIMRVSICICLSSVSLAMREQVEVATFVSQNHFDLGGEEDVTTDESDMGSLAHSDSQSSTPVFGDENDHFVMEEVVVDEFEPSQEMVERIRIARESVSDDLVFNETLALNFRSRDEVGSLAVMPLLKPTLRYKKRELEEEILQVTQAAPYRAINWMRLGRQLGKSATSAVFDIDSLPGYVIKYQMNCDVESAPIDDLTKEYYYLKKLEGLGIAPRALYLSRYTILGNPREFFDIDIDGKIIGSKTRKLNVDFSSWEAGQVCAGGRVRFMIMEKVGASIEEVLETNPQGIGLADALDTGARMIELIEKLHMAGFVHRDIHAGNFARGLKPNSLYLIDYGLSSHASAIFTDAIVSPWFERFRASPLAVFHRHLSPWEMQGYLASYRDDFVRTLGLVGALIHGAESYDAGIDASIMTSIDQAGMSLFGSKPHTKFSIMHRKIAEILTGHKNDTPLTALARRCGQSQKPKQMVEKLIETIQNVNVKLDKSVFAVPNYSRIVKMLRETAMVIRQCSETFVPIH